MPDTLIATLGQRPEAITVALDLLRDRHAIAQVIIVHTHPERSAIARAYQDLKAVLEQDYPDVPHDFYEIRRSDGGDFIDLIDHQTASDYFRGIYAALLALKQRGDTLHVLIAGGRKAMSVYAALAATLIFRRDDRLWHVVSPTNMVEHPGLFHIPDALRQQVYLVEMPLVPARIAIWDTPQNQLDDPLELVARFADTRQRLLDKLSDAELELANALLAHPEWTDDQLARALNKKARTVNNQLQAIYAKMGVDAPTNAGTGKKSRNPRMRQILLRILRGQY